jgi:transposase
MGSGRLLRALQLPRLAGNDAEVRMEFGLLSLVATVIDFCAGAGERRVGRPPTPTVRVVATLRRFLREGSPWRSLTASAGLVSGATLRRRLRTWAREGRLQKAHAVLVRLLRSGPDLIVDSCSVRAKRGGDLTGPNPTDRAKRGTKYHVAVDAYGVPVACVATAANVNDTALFDRLFLAAFAVLARVRTVFADGGYDAERHRVLCRSLGVESRIRRRGQPHRSGLGTRRWPVERSLAWLLENRRLALRYDRLGFVVQSLLQSACIFLAARRLGRQL